MITYDSLKHELSLLLGTPGLDLDRAVRGIELSHELHATEPSLANTQLFFTSLKVTNLGVTN